MKWATFSTSFVEEPPRTELHMAQRWGKRQQNNALAKLWNLAIKITQVLQDSLQRIPVSVQKKVSHYNGTYKMCNQKEKKNIWETNVEQI